MEINFNIFYYNRFNKYFWISWVFPRFIVWLEVAGGFFENLGSYEIILDRIDDTMLDILIGITGTLVYITSLLVIERLKSN